MWQLAFYQFYFLLLYAWFVHIADTFVTTQKQYWWDVNFETMHQQLFQIVTIMERWIIDEKWRFVKSIKHLKRSDKKVRWRCAAHTKSIQIVSQEGIKGPDTMANLVWANTYVSGYVMNDSVDIIIGSTYALHTSLGVFAPQLASIHWHAIGTK